MKSKYQFGSTMVRLAEECAEVTHIAMKIERFGIDNHHPKNPDVKNYELLEFELRDLERMIFLARDEIAKVATR